MTNIKVSLIFTLFHAIKNEEIKAWQIFLGVKSGKYMKKNSQKNMLNQHGKIVALS